MAINSTSSATSASTTSTSGVGKGSVIDVEGLVSKLDSIEQAPIDTLNVKVTKQDNSIRDLGIIKSKMSLFQAALQDFTSPVSYLTKSVTSSNDALVAASISQSSGAVAGIYNLHVAQIAKTATANYEFSLANDGSSLAQSGSFTLNSESITFNQGDSLESLRVAINAKSSDTGVRASIINTGSKKIISFTSIAGGAAGLVTLSDMTAGITRKGGQEGQDAIFEINGQEFTRSSNIVDEALTGVRLQLQSAMAEGDYVAISIASDNSAKAQNLLTNVGQAYNDLMASYTELTKFNADPEKRGSLYGFMDLRTMVDSISLSFMTPLTRANSSGTQQSITDTTGNPISFTSLGLELQLDGTLLFDAAIYESAVTHGAIDQLANGSVSPTRSIVNDAMTFGGKVDSYISGFEDQKSTLQNRIQDLQTRKMEKMARYRAQYASLDALLYRLQALNSSLTPTFTALNNPKN
ncbi:flagellar filament capping protein FliD [Polynucleobacter sp. MWH-Berg-3C6]|uniref:flagellar filament capping protein FliD n=1 Tax=Polynucleobacter sp. MWH-Berg-3C6 TaxID=1855882 RepID=UPI001C0B77D3|nr:flagellar filament capping protein FliD [Polynucleobacter sp. MWH-Berg-3C6]MBU3551633.1 flagellar filament capping protein FliD [Polynucleobacter sp. MWH-Berg-3C6]